MKASVLFLHFFDLLAVGFFVYNKKDFQQINIYFYYYNFIIILHIFFFFFFKIALMLLCFRGSCELFDVVCFKDNV
jgi:hypothetical protein